MRHRTHSPQCDCVTGSAISLATVRHAQEAVVAAVPASKPCDKRQVSICLIRVIVRLSMDKVRFTYPVNMIIESILPCLATLKSYVYLHLAFALLFLL